MAQGKTARIGAKGDEKMTKKALLKLIVYNLANAPALALQKTLDACKTDEERDEARRIFAAVGVREK